MARLPGQRQPVDPHGVAGEYRTRYFCNKADAESRNSTRRIFPVAVVG